MYKQSLAYRLFIMLPFFLFFNVYSAVSQTTNNKVDSNFDPSAVDLESAVDWIEINVFEKDNNFEFISNQILLRAKKEKDYNNAAYIHMCKSHWYYLNNRKYSADSIIFHQLKAIDYYKKDNNLDAVNENYLGLAMDYINNNESKKAEEVILKAIYYFEETANNLWLAQSHAQIAALYLSTKEPKKVIEYSELCYEILLENNEFISAASVLRYSSDAYRMLGNYEKALDFADKCIKVCSTNEFKQNIDLMFAAYETIGNVYIDKGMYEEALSYFEKAYRENIQFNGKENKDFFRYNIGNTLFLQQKYKEALPHLIAGINGKEHSKIDRASELYLTLSICYEKLGNYKKAIEYRDIAKTYESELYEEKLSQVKSEMTIKYETEVKDEALAAQALLIEEKNNVQKLIIGVGALLLILLIIVYFFLRKSKKATALISSKNSENELLLKEIHHRVKNNLEMVKSLIALQSAQLEDSATKDAMIASQNRVQSMGIIHQKLYQGTNLGSIEMKGYFINLGEGILDSFNAEDKVKISCAMDNLELDVDTAVPIGLIVNELLTNSLKYAFPTDRKGQIEISLAKSNFDTLTLKVADNGIGKIEGVSAKGTGFGTQLVQLLTQQLNGSMQEKTENGTLVSFQFKLDTAA